MRERYAEFVRWAILFLIVLLFTYILDAITAPILSWLGQVLEDVVAFAGAPDHANLAGSMLTDLGETLVHFAAGGFAYTWLVHVPWKRGALTAWGLMLFMRYGGALAIVFFSQWFYINAVLALAAAFGGAWYYEEKRYNEHLVNFRRSLHERLALA